MNRYIISLPASRDLQAIADYFAVENVPHKEQGKPCQARFLGLVYTP